MAATLALIAAFMFALAAALQQKGALNLPTISLADPKSLARLAGQTMWLIGTAALLVGYVFQAAALDRGRLAIIQPLLVTTVVFALPLGYFLTKQHVGRREVIGALVIIAGLALFTYFGDPAGGNENAPNSEWLRRNSRARRPFGRASLLRQPWRPLHEGRRLRDGRRDPVRALGGADEADARRPARERRHDALALVLLRAGAHRGSRLRAPAGVARHRSPGTVGRDGFGRESRRRHPRRHPPPRRAVEQAGVARRRSP